MEPIIIEDKDIIPIANLIKYIKIPDINPLWNFFCAYEIYPLILLEREGKVKRYEYTVQTTGDNIFIRRDDAIRLWNATKEESHINKDGKNPFLPGYTPTTGAVQGGSNRRIDDEKATKVTCERVAVTITEKLTRDEFVVLVEKAMTSGKIHKTTAKGFYKNSPFLAPFKYPLGRRKA
jgi:hypothetical protein